MKFDPFLFLETVTWYHNYAILFYLSRGQMFLIC